VAAFPITYLGILLHFQKLRREGLQPLLEKMIKIIAGWKGKLLSYAGWLILIKTCHSSILIYLIFFLKFPKWTLDILKTHMANFLWDDDEGHGKIHLANWQMVNMRKENGDLVIPNMRDLNLILLGF